MHVREELGLVGQDLGFEVVFVADAFGLVGFLVQE